MASGESITPEISITPIWLELSPKPEASLPVTERIVAQTIRVISKQTAASEPTMMPI